MKHFTLPQTKQTTVPKFTVVPWWLHVHPIHPSTRSSLFPTILTYKTRTCTQMRWHENKKNPAGISNLQLLTDNTADRIKCLFSSHSLPVISKTVFIVLVTVGNSFMILQPLSGVSDISPVKIMMDWWSIKSLQTNWRKWVKMSEWNRCRLMAGDLRVARTWFSTRAIRAHSVSRSRSLALPWYMGLPMVWSSLQTDGKLSVFLRLFSIQDMTSHILSMKTKEMYMAV